MRTECRYNVYSFICTGLAQSTQLLLIHERVSECSGLADACVSQCIIEHMCEETVGEHTPRDWWANRRNPQGDIQEYLGMSRALGRAGHRDL